MPKVTFLPMNQTVEARVGESILDVAINNDIPLQHACGGFCACTTCQIIVKAGDENISKMDDEELDRLESVGETGVHSRLGCQSKVQGDITVEIVNIDS